MNKTTKSCMAGLGASLFLLLACIPFALDSVYVTTVATVALVFVILSTGLNLVYGYVGLLSFAQVAFWGAGGYTGALLAVDLGISPWIATLCAGALAGILALGIGIPALRLSRHSFAIVTLTFALLMELVARDWTSLTRGPLGVPGLPALEVSLFGRKWIDGSTATGFYLIMLIYTIIVLVLTWRLVRSPIGRTFLAVKHDEALARSQGIDANRYKLLALCISAVFSGIAGALYVFDLSIVDPSIFDFYYSEMMLIMVILGGAGTLGGVVVTSVLFTILPEALRITPSLRLVIFGFILIASVMVLPEGVGGYLRQRRLRLIQQRSRAEQP